jgi:hypothetical protein
MVFLESERPHFSPFNQLPKHNIERAEMTDVQIKARQNQIDKEKKDRQANIDKYKKKNNNAEPAPSKFPAVDETMMIAGYVGQAKGIQQVLWERGLWKDKMVMSLSSYELNKRIVARKEVPDPDLNADEVLGLCADFQLEKSALSEVVEKRGHILLLSVKCHPEMAGCGVEYCWGISKRDFRKENRSKEQQTGKNLVARVKKTLSKDVLKLDRIWSFERRTRTYMYMYRDIGLNKKDVSLSYKDLEQQMLLCKTHDRNIEETERVYLRAFN